MQNKFQNPWRALAEPLEHLPDAQGVKYHLQLNIYRFIIEKYYGYVVSSMFVVCLHPELQDGPWVNEVPAMPAEISAIMQLRRDHIRRQGCGSPHISGTLPMDVSGGAANFAEDGAWNRFKLLRAVVFFPGGSGILCTIYHRDAKNHSLQQTIGGGT